MLNTMRKNTKVIVWSVIFCFALWGAFSVGEQFRKEGRVAGEVFGKNISFQEYDRFYRASQILSFNGQPIKDPELLRQQTWQTIIYSKEAQKRKIQVSDDEVRSQIGALLKAQGVEAPTAAIYRRWLESTIKETPHEFEKQVREILRIQKLMMSVEAEPVEEPTEEEIQKRFEEEQKTAAADKNTSAAQSKTLDKETEKAIREKLVEEKKQAGFIQWNMILLSKANLKDYMPRAEEVPLPLAENPPA